MCSSQPPPARMVHECQDSLMVYIRWSPVCLATLHGILTVTRNLQTDLDGPNRPPPRLWAESVKAIFPTRSWNILEYFWAWVRGKMSNTHNKFINVTLLWQWYDIIAINISCVYSECLSTWLQTLQFHFSWDGRPMRWQWHSHQCHSDTCPLTNLTVTYCPPTRCHSDTWFSYQCHSDTWFSYQCHSDTWFSDQCYSDTWFSDQCHSDTWFSYQCHSDTSSITMGHNVYSLCCRTVNIMLPHILGMFVRRATSL